MDNDRRMFEPRISAGTLEKLPETKATANPFAETISSWSSYMEGHAKKSVESHCELANKRRNNKTKSRHHAWMTISLEKNKLDQLMDCPQFAHKLF